MKKIFALLPLFFVSFYLEADSLPFTNELDNREVCYANADIAPSSFHQVPQCNVQITSLWEFGLETEVAFVTDVQRPPGTSVSGSSFFVTFQNGDNRTFQGFLNSFGNPVARVPVSCSNRITNVSVTVFVTNCGSDSFSKSYSPGVCAGGGLGFN